jgi:hypothetical protein
VRYYIRICLGLLTFRSLVAVRLFLKCEKNVCIFLSKTCHLEAAEVNSFRVQLRLIVRVRCVFLTLYVPIDATWIHFVASRSLLLS